MHAIRYIPAGLSRKYARRQRKTAWWATTRTFSCRSSSIMTGSRRATKSSYDYNETKKMSLKIPIFYNKKPTSPLGYR